MPYVLELGELPTSFYKDKNNLQIFFPLQTDSDTGVILPVNFLGFAAGVVSPNHYGLMGSR